MTERKQWKPLQPKVDPVLGREPLYDLDKGTWDKRCPCIRAEQRDPECPWHGREASQ